MRSRALMAGVLAQTPLFLFGMIVCVFSLLSERFLDPQNWMNILVQSSSVGIAAIGMTFVLLTAGVDLSLGSIMFLAVAVAGKLILADYPLSLAFVAALLVGASAGVVNGLLVTRIKMIPFITTLGMLFVLRGLGLWLTETRAMNMPDSVVALGSSSWLGIPLPIWMLLSVALTAHSFLAWHPWGRQIYAIGHDADSARRAGIRVDMLLFLVYVICGLCAAISGLVALPQSGAVSPTFGNQREFAAIAAAVLGGVSLFGGRGNVLPGT
ncbi:MAG: ABC transporter permease, partial [bacterium]|nr:ABC transporter permease [bacterium]